MRAFFDTNVLVYAALREEEVKAERARECMREGGVTSVQVWNEFANVFSRKFGRKWPEVREAERDLRDLVEVMPLSVGTHERALTLAARFRFGFYDALIVASALEASCEVLYTEDLQDGQKIEGLTIRNPFCEGKER
jgi:predicted nucleic acid-binding protein